MRLGFVERQQLPSARRYVNAHRDRQHNLTALGHQAAKQAEMDMAAFYDRLSTAVYSAHPYFQNFIHILGAGPLACPEITEGEVEDFRRSGKGTEHWISHAREQLTQHKLSTSQKDEIREVIVSVVRKRFGHAREKKPGNKEMAEALNDAFIEIRC